MSKTKKKIVYVTKKMLVSKSTKAIQEASERAMNTVGYIIVAKDGWLLKIYKDGKIEKIKELEKPEQNQELILD